MSGATFSYDEMVTRNAGFLTDAEQATLKNARVFVCGVGGMGGAAIQSLVRAGVGHLTIADMDTFEVSNLNRQLFATMDSVGRGKVEATADALRRINPDIGLATYGAEWVDELDEILPRHSVVINGMDDLAAGIQLYRKAREHGATVIDAYTSPLPSVTVVHPIAPRPEERLAFPTIGTDWRAITAGQANAAKLAEAVYVMVHSSSRHHVDLGVAAEMMAGTRSRPSFAPMVIATGTMMAFEAVKLLLGKETTDSRGIFYNPWRQRIERPRSPVVAAVMSRLARRFIVRLLGRDG